MLYRDGMALDANQTVYGRTELAALHAVVIHGGFSAAARMVRIAEATLFRRVRRLERSLGIALVVTVDRRSTPTPAGRVMAEAASRINAVLAGYPPQLQPRHLHLLERIKEAGSISAAAEQLAVPQPALSRLLRRLEDHLGTPVFIRSRSGVTPTPAGQDLLTALRRAYREQELLLEHLNRTTLCNAADRLDTSSGRELSHRTPTGSGYSQDTSRTSPARPAESPGNSAGDRMPSQLRIAATSLLPAGRLIAHLAQIFSDTQWQTEASHHSQELQPLHDGALDVVIGFTLADSNTLRPAQLHYLSLVDEPVWLAVAASNPLATREEITLTELAGHTWITRPHGPLRHLLDDACHNAGFTPHIGHISDNNGAIRGLVTADFGITLASPAYPSAPDIAVVPLTGVPELRYHLLWNPSRLPDACAARIATTITDWYLTDSLKAPRYWNWILTHRR